ncbi:DMT family transporter [Saccharibacillus sp. CPCC 101409]|uniref:DMT family transporter n=1 Tax=Saccharibacillus sp. CPCC 101409 TaxID=3058041 RepID=UPI0026741BB8|nr:DMT family transporter [Saccharibacillus sp. CPCC 101409]MDO3411884.1 DMT family transporter [Saccharibacillus sp. CPCC 101409]
MTNLSPKKTLGMVLFLVLIWGINWPLTKMALDHTPPLLFSGMRTLLGGLILLPVALLTRPGKLRWKSNAGIYIALALLNIVGYYGLQTIGIGYLPAGLFSTLVFLQPILLGIFSRLWLGESLGRLKAAGLLLGFAGVGVISLGGLEGRLSPLGIALALLSALCWALGTIYTKKQGARIDSVWAVTVQLLLGGTALMLLGSGTESWSAVQWTPDFIGILLFISVFVIAGGWMIYFLLIENGEVSTVGAYTFLIPVLSNVFSIVLLRESATITLLIGLLMIAGSIMLVNRRTRSGGPAGIERASD